MTTGPIVLDDLQLPTPQPPDAPPRDSPNRLTSGCDHSAYQPAPEPRGVVLALAVAR
jgi:hypothetical protein